MKDIENAYLAEQNYINNNLGVEVDLLDLLQPFGYNTLEEYFSDRFLYLLKQQNLSINHYILSVVKNEMFNAFAAGAPSIFAVDDNCTWAWVGNPDYFDYDKATELGVSYCDLEYNGGAIITDNNDFNIAMNLPIQLNLLVDKFIEEFNKLLINKGFNTFVDGNDILLEDGRKVAGAAFISNNKSGLFAISIALSDHTDLINQLCKKKSEKTPWYLEGITKEEIEEEVTKWLQHI